jgi:alginate O-acetyltransferase complex protein AlgI
MFALYVSFFPQLVAGPIERSTRLLPQLYTKQKFKWENISIGFRLILWGAFKKIIIADYTYLFLSNVFGNPEIYSGLAYVIAAFGVALWIYADFSGYTDMAIGSAKLFGVNLFPNFKRPYLSRTIAELWQRWHISLTNWINHYIFRPWIRNTKNENQRHLVTIAVFFIIGLWHGANWTFIAFGVFHGLLTVIYRLTKKPNRSLMKLLFGQGRIRKLADILLTFSLWSFSGFFFFSDSIKKSFKMIYNMFNWNMNDLHLMISMPNFKATELCIVGFGTVLLIFSDLINSKDLENPFDNIKKRYIRWIIYLMLLFGLIVFGHQIENQFFYFQV